MAVMLPSTQAMATVAPAATLPASSVEADCDGEEEKAWVESPEFWVRTIHYSNCRDVPVARRAYVYDTVPAFLDCQEVPPHSTVSWTTSMFPIGWGVTTC